MAGHSAATISKSEFAGLVDVSSSRVSQWIKLGLPVLPSGRLHRRKALLWIASQAASDGGGWVVRRGSDVAVRAVTLLNGEPLKSESISEREQDAEAFLAARRRREILRSEREHFDLEKLRGRYVLRQEVEDAAFRRARDERDALLAWPNRIAAIMAGDLGLDERILHTHLERYVREFLSERSEVGPLLAPEVKDR